MKMKFLNIFSLLSECLLTGKDAMQNESSAFRCFTTLSRAFNQN